MIALVDIRRLAGALLLFAFLAPLVASGAAAATDDCCPDCPMAAAAAEFDERPCHGSPLLVCCDDVATTPGASPARVDARPVHPVVLASSPVARTATRPEFSKHGPPDLIGSGSALRHSVVLRL